MPSDISSEFIVLLEVLTRCEVSAEDCPATTVIELELLENAMLRPLERVNLEIYTRHYRLLPSIDLTETLRHFGVSKYH